MFDLFDPDIPRYYNDQWHLHQSTSLIDFDKKSSINADKAWSFLRNYGDPELVIGMADDGCCLSHTAFNINNTIRDWGYFKNNKLIVRRSYNASPTQMFDWNDLHGSSCCGLIAAHPNAGLTVGVSPNCGLIPVKWDRKTNGSLDISERNFLKVLDFIEDKVDIFLNTWSSIPIWEWSDEVTDRIKRLSNSGGRRGKGVIFIWAAGNSNCPIHYQSPIDTPYHHVLKFEKESPQWQIYSTKSFINCMSGLSNSIIVGGVTSQAQRAHFSNYGNGIDICAPCNNYHTYRRMPVKGLGITTINGRNDEVTNNFKGTSGSAAITAGVAALVLSSNAKLTATEVKQVLINSASQCLNFEKYPKTTGVFFDPEPVWDVSPIVPYDVGVFNEKGWSPWFGYGKVDAFEAVKSASKIAS